MFNLFFLRVDRSFFSNFTHLFTIQVQREVLTDFFFSQLFLYHVEKQLKMWLLYTNRKEGFTGPLKIKVAVCGLRCKISLIPLICTICFSLCRCTHFVNCLWEAEDSTAWNPPCICSLLFSHHEPVPAWRCPLITLHSFTHNCYDLISEGVIVFQIIFQ